MNPGLKLQLMVIVASGVSVSILGLLILSKIDAISPTTMRYLLPIPPLSVAAYSFVLPFVRDRTEALPGLAESSWAILGATAFAAALFAFMCAAMLLLIRLGARFLS